MPSGKEKEKNEKEKKKKAAAPEQLQHKGPEHSSINILHSQK